MVENENSFVIDFEMESTEIIKNPCAPRFLGISSSEEFVCYIPYGTPPQLYNFENKTTTTIDCSNVSKLIKILVLCYLSLLDYNFSCLFPE